MHGRLNGLVGGSERVSSGHQAENQGHGERDRDIESWAPVLGERISKGRRSEENPRHHERHQCWQRRAGLGASVVGRVGGLSQ